ncbi:hypothetical protein G3352_23495 [Paenibacillus sp. ALJ109b]|nr:hypothetical protein [Paenibacillus sp. ALJ109b]
MNGLLAPITGRLFVKYGPKWIVLHGIVLVQDKTMTPLKVAYLAAFLFFRKPRSPKKRIPIRLLIPVQQLLTKVTEYLKTIGVPVEIGDNLANILIYNG